MFTVTPRLVQQFRYDMGWQSNKGFTNSNYGSGRGLELVPLDRIGLYTGDPATLTPNTTKHRHLSLPAYKISDRHELL